jgi:polyhydroxybutyrate depolymerase
VYDRHWNDCRKNSNYKANQENINDIAFFEKMIAYFQEIHEIDSNRVFVTGISNGGQMCYKLAYEIPEKIKGIAPFVANIPYDFNNDCTPKNVATSVLIINGTEDPINPYEGGWVVIEQDSSRGAVLSTRETVDYWKSLLPCEPKMEQLEYPDYALDDDSTVIRYQYFCEEENKKVALLKIIGGGHTVPMLDTPPITERFKKVVGNKNRDINAPRIVMDFFESLN